jgi:hypothetical protein
VGTYNLYASSHLGTYSHSRTNFVTLAGVGEYSVMSIVQDEVSVGVQDESSVCVQDEYMRTIPLDASSHLPESPRPPCPSSAPAWYRMSVVCEYRMSTG